MNKPQYEIHGQERNRLKKELSTLQTEIRNFWQRVAQERDYAYIHGSSDGFPLDDETNKAMLIAIQLKEQILKKRLAFPYKEKEPEFKNHPSSTEATLIGLAIGVILFYTIQQIFTL